VTNEKTYTATCTESDCFWMGMFSDYEDRARAVGKHRVKTGHNVEMNEDPRV
jgi:hypothetical protein